MCQSCFVLANSAKNRVVLRQLFVNKGWSLLGPSLSPSHSTNCKVYFSRKTSNAAYQLIESLWESEFLKGATVLDIYKKDMQEN